MSSTLPQPKHVLITCTKLTAIFIMVLDRLKTTNNSPPTTSISDSWKGHWKKEFFFKYTENQQKNQQEFYIF